MSILEWILIGVIALFLIICIVLAVVKAVMRVKTKVENGEDVNIVDEAKNVLSSIIESMTSAEQLYGALAKVTGTKQSTQKLQAVLKEFKSYCNSNQLEYNEEQATELINSIVNFKNI